MSITACGSDGNTEAVATYHSQMSSLMPTNRRLADELLRLALSINTDESDATAVAQGWQERIVPLAIELQTGVVNIQSENPDLQVLHSQIVTCWTTRSESYAAMVQSFQGGDADAFEAAVQAIQGSKEAEEAYFVGVNNLLSGYDLHLFQYPG